MKQTKKRKGIRLVKRIGLGVFLVIVVGLVMVLYNPLRTLASLRKVDDYPLYVMNYHGGYLFDWYLKQGVESEIFKRLEEMNKPEACTTFAALSPQGDIIVGRNFDWRHHPALLLFTDPPGGYASVSMVDIYYLGYRGEEESWTQRLNLLFAPYVIIDGMNEHGLAVSTMKVPCRIGPLDPQKKTIVNNHVMRLALDYAKSVDEAIALVQDYNIYFPQACTHHLFADKSGNSAVVEYINGEVVVIRNHKSWQVSTNFLISEEKPEETNAACWRYNKVYEALNEANGNITQEEAMTIASRASMSNTVWSIIYNLTTGDIQVVMGRNYDREHQFRFEMKDR